MDIIDEAFNNIEKAYDILVDAMKNANDPAVFENAVVEAIEYLRRGLWK